MNSDDSKRFARYRKGYVSTNEDIEEEILKIKQKEIIENNNKKQILGYVANINLKPDNLINNITNISKL